MNDVLKEMHDELCKITRKLFANEVTAREYSDKVAQTIHEYASKLRLADDVKEQ